MPGFDPTLPPRADASDEDYLALRAGLAHAEYSQSAVCRYFALDSFADFFEGHAPTSFSTRIEDPLAALCQVFLLGRAAPRQLLAAQLGDIFVDAAMATHLLGESEVDAEALVASASLYPVEDIWIASDRVVPVPGTQPRQDVVYPAATHSAQMFLTLLPRQPCKRFLEVCGGCGPAAVLAGGFADDTTSGDLEPRSAAFAAFNGRLQGIARFQSVTGSLFEGTHGEYDFIAAHPPYMPSMGSGETYYAGGDDGTMVIRGLLAELHTRLAPGGIFYAVMMVPQGRQQPVEENLRKWLGEAERHFDVFTFPHRNTSIHDMAMSAILKSGGALPQLLQIERQLGSSGFTEYVLGAVLLRRHREEEAPIDIRRQLCPRTGWRELLWCVEWETARKDRAVLSRLLESPLRVRPEFELHSVHKPVAEGLLPVQMRVVTTYPFAMESQIQDWMSHIFARADGSLTGRQLLGSLKSDELLHPETPEMEFAQLLATFVSGGFLELSSCPLPSEAE